MGKYIFYIWVGAAQLTWTICHTRKIGFSMSNFVHQRLSKFPSFVSPSPGGLCFGCVLAVFWLHHYCIQLCFLYLLKTLLCKFPSPLPPLTRGFHFDCISIVFIHTYTYLVETPLCKFPCFVSAARPACPPPPLLTSTSSPQTWRASETHVERLTDFKS